MRYQAVLALLVLAACNTSPVGYNQLGDRVPPARSDSLRPDSQDTYFRYVPLSSGDRLCLGRDSQYVSRMLIRFPIPETLTLNAISSVTLLLHAVDTSKSMPFVCYACSTAWDSSAATWQMADDVNHWYQPGGDHWPVELVRDTVRAETLFATLPYQGQDSLVRQAIRENGLLFLTASPDTGFVWVWSAGAASALKPSVRVTYADGKTVKNYVASATTSLVDTVSHAVSPLALLVGSGAALRTWVRFRLDSIPMAATIARAELSFRPEVEYRRQESLPLAVHRLTGSFEDKGAYAGFDPIPAASLLYVPAADTDSVVTFSLGNLVQYWITHRDSLGRDTANYGLVITAEPEWGSLFRLRVPRLGPHALRLKLEYVLPPGDRFQ